MDNTKIYKDIDAAIRNKAGADTIQETWHKYNRIQTDWFYEVDWDSMRKAMKLSPVASRNWIIKRAARDCGANAVRLRRKERQDDLCPFCSKSETVEHIYLCQDPKVQEIWDRAINEFGQYLQSIGTDPNISSQLLTGLQQWRSGVLSTNLPMIADQSKIGWNGILEGILGRHWKEEQAFMVKSS